MVTYEKAKEARDKIDRKLAKISAELKQFPKGRPMGMTPDHVKFSSEFQCAKFRYDKAFSELREFNKIFTKIFAKEIREERDERRRRNLKP